MYQAANIVKSDQIYPNLSKRPEPTEPAPEPSSGIANPAKLQAQIARVGTPGRQRAPSKEAVNMHRQRSKTSFPQRPPSPGGKLMMAALQQATSTPIRKPAAATSGASPLRTRSPSPVQSAGCAQNSPRPVRKLTSGKAVYSSTPRLADRGAGTPPAPLRSPCRSRPASPAVQRAYTPERMQNNTSAVPSLRPSRSSSPHRLLAPITRPSSLTRESSDRVNRRVGSPCFTPRGQQINNHVKCSTPRNTAGARSDSETGPCDAAMRLPAPHRESLCKAPPRLESCTLRWLDEVLRPQPNSPPMVVERLALQSLPKMDGHNNVAHSDIEFIEVLGTGSFGAVWRGRLRGQEIAVKQCVVGDVTDTNMLLEEIRCLQSLHHPCLVSYLGCCTKAPHVLMLMEYMPAGSLNHFLFKRKQRLEFQDKARMAYEVAAGLVYIHGLGVVHRDLKTANIVLDGNLHCKICDFGLTLMLESTHVTVNKFEGSPRYMAPEQFQSKARITDKCDIWQFGCVMLELFCLVVPFTQCTGMQQIVAELLVRKRPPSAPNDADPRARLFVQSSLRISPAQRPVAVAFKRALLGTWKGHAVAEAEGVELAGAEVRCGSIGKTEI